MSTEFPSAISAITIGHDGISGFVNSTGINLGNDKAGEGHVKNIGSSSLQKVRSVKTNDVFSILSVNPGLRLGGVGFLKEVTVVSTLVCPSTDVSIHMHKRS